MYLFYKFLFAKLSMAELIDTINDGLAKYYASLDAYYDDNFREYCEDQGIHDVTEELDVDDLGDCMILEFDDDFPFRNPQPADDDEKNQRIFEIIKKCTKAQVAFNVNLPKCFVLSCICYLLVIRYNNMLV